jgi:hypothetical protein
MDRNELPLEPCHLGVPSGVSKMITEPMVRLRQVCTYLELTLTPYPNEPKRDLTRPTSPRGSIECVENDLQAYGTFNTHHAPIFHQD